MNELAGRVAIVTGASRGIGVGIARRLAAEGAAVAVTARSLDAHPHLPGTLRETVQTIEKQGGRAVAIPADLFDPAQRARIVEVARAELGPVDILVNNAAAAFFMPFQDYSEKRFRVAFELNVRAPFELCQAVVPSMRERRRGWIVNITSATAELPQGPPFSAFHRSGSDMVYGSSKAALERFTAGLAAELHADGIPVNALGPVAQVVTPGTEAMGIRIADEFIEPLEAMAEATLALCSCGPDFTGRILKSTPLLHELGRPIRSLDGRRAFEPQPGR